MSTQNIPWNLVDTFARRPAASKVQEGYLFFASDIGVGYVCLIDDTTKVHSWAALNGTPVKLTKAGLPAAASFDLTSVALGSNRPVGALLSLRVTANTGGTFVGTYVLTDNAGDMLTPATHTVVGVARISDDGTTITFPTNDVTGFIIQYIPRS